MQRTKQYRRHHRNRMIQRALRSQILTSWYDVDDTNNPQIQQKASLFHNHLAMCSCDMCGNQRHNKWLSRLEQLTMNERRFIDTYKCQLEEYFETEKT